MRLTFFGDSFTYGQGFPDCINSSQPSKLGWAAQVASNFNSPYINLANPGSSNQRMFWAIRDMDLSDLGFVIVQWTFGHRDMILTETGPTYIGLWSEDQPVTDYYHIHPNIDIARRAVMTIEHAALYLNYFNIPYLFFANEPYNEYSIDNLVIDYESKYVSGILPCEHPDQHSNAVWAEVVTNHIRDYLGGTRHSIAKVVV